MIGVSTPMGGMRMATCMTVTRATGEIIVERRIGIERGRGTGRETEIGTERETEIGTERGTGTTETETETGKGVPEGVMVEGIAIAIGRESEAIDEPGVTAEAIAEGTIGGRIGVDEGIESFR